MKKSILLMKSLMVFSLLFVSCNDDDSDGVTCTDSLTGELTDVEMSFSGTWVLTAVVAEDEIDLTDDGEDNASTDLFVQYDDCEKDIVYGFEDDRAYSFVAGGTSDCDNEQTTIGTWKLNETYGLTVVSSCFSQTSQLEVNDDFTEFTSEGNINYIDVNGETITSKTTFTYTKTAM
ncbi:DUF5004 domain-containing protein [Algibacter lectus]|uniref:Uncharacterized protein DUF5004 n=1 Tax=Algibacter lectus TaxID=221126 RepID=A0A4V3HHA3_9FLAO|nr:DUF5004 domain-containing protein [Algibacter lectus]MWW23284.1 DUF5004 domain-containing protein [Algibacter lectus]TDY64041.1 uncharacterized protein DUF5004 [Algibacter lectus]